MSIMADICDQLRLDLSDTQKHTITNHHHMVSFLCLRGLMIQAAFHSLKVSSLQQKHIQQDKNNFMVIQFLIYEHNGSHL